MASTPIPESHWLRGGEYAKSEQLGWEQAVGRANTRTCPHAVQEISTDGFGEIQRCAIKPAGESCTGNICQFFRCPIYKGGLARGLDMP